ncbi:MAG TPA: Holliday junction resolvase RuvX [Bacteroidales bacterium]|jgi:putative Holliday junction resolvase|nr:Holliday junction resolvase RuvX [Bacteroidales bacterium]NLH32668.1 Holliday junction resolvase RuvX [Lentimicrobium sp.]OQC37072.1 MAG: putative Holliday junction resolvase [Bacteroidetes bacterium ADurb.Bin041]MBP7873851.1 Holliday junction resolvase RuvX [Bacteroidales bacterium]MCZ2283425.1 Holliday junction resolvase RuvX [Bacteroidales bacterium]
MGRILAIDYGQKRVGLAVTDEMQIIATGLDTVHVNDLFAYLEKYMEGKSIEKIVVGEPRNLDNTPSDSQRFIEPFIKKLKKHFPDIPVFRVDERFTSKMAKDVILSSGIGKKARQKKELVDKISATIMLQSFMQQQLMKEKY